MISYISGIAALGLLITFAGAPRRHGEDKLSLTSTDNISIVTGNRVTMLPGIIITPIKNNEVGITLPIIPAEDFNYLKFDANEYMDADAGSLNESDVLPEATETDFNYRKFNISDYNSDTEFSVDEKMELPVSENNSSTPELVVNEFEYLRFDVNQYIPENESEAGGLGEMPLEEVNTIYQSEITIPGETIKDFSYLKFDANRYDSSNSLDPDKQIELTEK